MMKALRALIEITLGLYYDLAYFCKVNIRYFASLISIALPFVMYILGQLKYTKLDQLQFGPELLVLVVVMVVLHYLKELANRLGTGNLPPIPRERFTEVDEEGEVTVEHRRLQEMLLFMADLEDYYSRKGLL